MASEIYFCWNITEINVLIFDYHTWELDSWLGKYVMLSVCSRQESANESLYLISPVLTPWPKLLRLDNIVCVGEYETDAHTSNLWFTLIHFRWPVPLYLRNEMFLQIHHMYTSVPTNHLCKIYPPKSRQYHVINLAK